MLRRASPAAFATGAAFLGGAGIAARLAVVGTAGIVAGVAVGRKPIARLGPIGIDGGRHTRFNRPTSGEILLAPTRRRLGPLRRATREIERGQAPFRCPPTPTLPPLLRFTPAKRTRNRSPAARPFRHRIDKAPPHGRHCRVLSFLLVCQLDRLRLRLVLFPAPIGVYAPSRCLPGAYRAARGQVPIRPYW